MLCAQPMDPATNPWMFAGMYGLIGVPLYAYSIGASRS
jgi:hypothetical protein